MGPDLAQDETATWWRRMLRGGSAWQAARGSAGRTLGRVLLGLVGVAVGFLATWLAWGIGWTLATGCWWDCHSDPRPLLGAALAFVLVTVGVAGMLLSAWWGLVDRRWRRAGLVIIAVAMAAGGVGAVTVYQEGLRLLR